MRLGKRRYTFEPVLADRIYLPAARRPFKGETVVKCMPAGIGGPARGFSIGGRFTYVADPETGALLGLIMQASLRPVAS